MKKRGAFDFSFSWLFALIVGAFILFLAIIFISKFSATQADFIDTKNSKEISVLLNPLETGFEESGKTVLTLPTSSRLSSRCSIAGDFGSQTLNLRSENYDKYSENTNEISFHNKYIFFENNIKGKNFYIFSKPFNFPFKVATLNYIIPISQKYCFIGEYKDIRDIKDELTKVNLSNLVFVNSVTSSIDECPAKSIKVCFNKDYPRCSIFVDTTTFGQFVQKGEKSLYYEGNIALLFAAIFSDPALYECQLQRLLQRASSLANLYYKKFLIDQQIGCSQSSVGTYLLALKDDALTIENSVELSVLTKDTIPKLENMNPKGCPLW